jgi:hypothetical protein
MSVSFGLKKIKLWNKQHFWENKPYTAKHALKNAASTFIVKWGIHLSTITMHWITLLCHACISGWKQNYCQSIPSLLISFSNTYFLIFTNSRRDYRQRNWMITPWLKQNHVMHLPGCTPTMHFIKCLKQWHDHHPCCIMSHRLLWEEQHWSGQCCFSK